MSVNHKTVKSESEKVTRPDFSEKQISRQAIYSGKIINVSLDRVTLPDGTECTREVAEHPGAAAIVPLIDKETILLEWQYRYPLRRHILEIPAGKLEFNEDPHVAAERELLEETGYRANKWQKMLTMIPTPGFCDEEVTLYLAEELHYVGHPGEEGEFVFVEKTSIKTALAQIEKGEITDGKTIIALLWLAQYVKKS